MCKFEHLQLSIVTSRRELLIPSAGRTRTFGVDERSIRLVRPSADLDSVLEAKSVLTAADLATFKADASPATLEHVRG